MKLIVTLLLVLMSPIVSHAQSDWITFKADQRISIKFPSKPEEISPGIYMAFEADTSVVYCLTVIAFEKLGGDSTILKPIIKDPEFALKLREFTMKSFQAVDMGEVKIGEWKGFTSYSSSGVDRQKKKYDMFIFFVGDKMYNLTAIRLPKIGDAKIAQFFVSAQVTH